MSTGKAEYVEPAQGAFLPGPVLLLGAPGVGKGTQAQKLMESFGVPQISTGDLLRAHVQNGTELGGLAKRLMDDGKLVPDKIVNAMVADRLRLPDIQPGYVLDGFPRTKAQAIWLDSELAQSTNTVPLVAVQIHVLEQDLLQRITGRRVCPVCRRIYNIYSHPSVTEGICDFDGAGLQHRSDDTEDAFAKRMMEYESKTSAVIEHYRAAGRYREIEGIGSVDEVGARIAKALRALRASTG